MSKVLAINGGEPILKKPLEPFPHYLGAEEEEAVLRVVRSGTLSDFVADPKNFLGGREVQRLEREFCKKFKIKFAVTFNSATTALHGALVALKIGSGDEVIVPPYTMSATASAILMAGATPVFADISEQDFCLDPRSVKEQITKRTRALMVVNLFGGPAEFNELLKIARTHNLKIIEDNAQAPGAMYCGQFTGTIGDVGVFSLNTHKVIQCGEGGVLVTNDEESALRARLVRNHGEAVAEKVGDGKHTDIVGSNYRMTELQAAVGAAQLRKLGMLNVRANELAGYLTEKLKTVPGLIPPIFDERRKHVFYVYPIRVTEEFGVPRDKFADAMTAEGFFMHKGYIKPLYHLPLFKKYASDCPVVERMFERELTYTAVCKYPNVRGHIDLFIAAVKKILDNRGELNESSNQRV